jgi:hypothetical protein
LLLIEVALMATQNSINISAVNLSDALIKIATSMETLADAMEGGVKTASESRPESDYGTVSAGRPQSGIDPLTDWIVR